MKNNISEKIEESIKKIKAEEKQIRKYLPYLLKNYKDIPEICLLTENINS